MHKVDDWVLGFASGILVASIVWAVIMCALVAVNL